MKNYYLKAAVIGGILFSSIGANAQVSGTNVFLRGKYVEVGVGHLGYYGSDSSAPAGYHPHCAGCITPGGIGFVADPDSTGWSTGSPHYMGDYFLPGSPFEGWDIQTADGRCEAYNAGGGTTFTLAGGMPAASVVGNSYSASGSTVAGTWQGMVDSMLITQVTSLDTNAMYFTVKVTLTNLAVAPKDNLYYVRSVDPDNDETWPGGGFTTHNTIEHQLPGGVGAAVVSATGYSGSSAYMALGTGDTSSRAFIYNAWPIDSAVDLSSVYGVAGGGYYFDEGTDHPGDIAIGLIVNIPHLATVDSATDSVHRTTAATALHPANSATFKYFYAFAASAVNNAINATKADTQVVNVSLGVQNVNASSDVTVYPNPTRNMINVSGLEATDRLMMYDMMGRVMQNWSAHNTGVNTFGTNSLPSGAYVLVVSDASGNVKARVPVRKQ